MNDKTSPFRSVDDWKSALMTLPDNGFFELLRSVFGNIKTPFSKQRLMDDLFALLSRDEIRKIIAAYIDGQDHKIIAAVALLDEPAPGELESFFAGELTCAELHALVLNLEERLILYRFRGNSPEAHSAAAQGGLRLALNPVLEKVLSPFAADTASLFPSFPPASGVFADSALAEEDGIAAAAFTDSRTLAALFAFLYDHAEEELLKFETGTLAAGTQLRGLRKKILDEGKKIFPALDLELAVKALLHLGLFQRGNPEAAGDGYQTESYTLAPCVKKIEEFRGLSPAERQEYWAAGVYLCLNETADNAAASLYRNRLRKLASLIHRFMGLLEGEKQYPETTLRRLLELLTREDRGTGNLWGARLFDDRIQIPFAPFLAALEKAGLLEKAAPIKEKRWKTAKDFHRIEEDIPPEDSDFAPVIVMNTAFSVILYPEITFADALLLASFCSVKETVAHNQPDGSAVCFELTRESAVRGFDQSITAADMIELLNRLSLNRLDENLEWTLKDWETRYAAVCLHQGIVLNLTEDRRYLAETRALASLIRRTLAPGVYLLSSGDRGEIIRALRKAGVDIIAQPPSDPPYRRKTENVRFGIGSYTRNTFPHLDSGEAAPAGIKADSAENAAEESPQEAQEAESIKLKFRRFLENKRLAKQERDELEARIDRRLILTEAQLEGASLRFEKLEARGLDYAGKSMIAKQAIETGSLLDLSWPGPGGTTRQATGAPVALEKKDGESILVLEPQASADTTLPETTGTETAPQATIRVPLGKISHLRRIKQSIFGV